MKIFSADSARGFPGLEEAVAASWRFKAAAILISFLVTGLDGYDGDFRRHSERACEGYKIQLRCPGKDIINVQRAAYGRQDDMTCVVEAHEMQDTHCLLPNTRDVVARRCNGNTSCIFIVGPEIFRDPCPGTKKYLNVMYECVPFLISCPGKLTGATLTSRTLTPQSDNAAWMKDPYQVSDRLFYMGYKKFQTRQLYEYETIEDMTGRKRPKRFYHLPHPVEGTGFVVYDRSLFFTPEGTRRIVRFDLSTQAIEADVEIPAANYDGTSPYAIDLSTDIDLAVDENGLWAIYATEYNGGNIVISRLKHHNLAIVKTWTTSYDKLSALNAFMVCGVLYTVNYTSLKIDYMFNTTSNIGTNINIPIPGLTRNASTINYNSKEQNLYVWDKKQAITYRLNFEPIVVKTTTTSPKTTTTSPTTTTVYTTPKPAIKPVAPVLRKCVGREARGLIWPDTVYRGVAQLNCPGSSQGYAHWICGGNVTHPQWTTRLPDFTQCVSAWIREIEYELNNGRTSGAELSQKFTSIFREKVEKGMNLNSWDIATSIQLLDAFLRQATTDSESAATLTGSVLKSASLLLNPSLQEAWNALSFAMQNHLASELINIVEDTAFFLASDISATVSSAAKKIGSDEDRKGAPENNLNWSEERVSLGIRVDPIGGSKASVHATDYETVIWTSGKGDKVRLDTNAVVDALADYGDDTKYSKQSDARNQSSARHLAIVLLSFSNLGQYLKDGELHGAGLRPEGPRVLSVSAATIKLMSVPDKSHMLDPPTSGEVTSVIVNRHQSLDLARPLTMTIAHQPKDLKYHACTYWDYSERKSTTGRWSRQGCRLVESNSTQTTCECNHMTSFAALSSSIPFPPLGYKYEGTTTPDYDLNIVFRDLPILRAGLTISFFFLLIVAVTLFTLSIAKRLKSDMNTIHKNIVLSLIVTEIVFLCGIDRTLVPDVCGAVAALLHFGLLATFTWGALEAFHLMVILGDVTERHDRWRWYYFVGYGIPTVVVAVSAAVDHAGYGTVAVCWLKTEGSFIWSFIGPSCFVIICCMLFLSLTMYRLHLYSVNFSDAPCDARDNSVRAGVARSCVLMFLLCALWSCGVLWLSNFQPRLTAVLFCILSSLYGIASFVLHCILPSEVRKYYALCFAKVSKKSHHQHIVSAQRLRHMSNNSQTGRFGSSLSHAGTLRPDVASAYGGYHTTATECTTTLLPVSPAQSAVLAKAAAVMERSGRSASDIDVTRISSLDNRRSASYANRGHSDGSTFDLMDETNPKVPMNAFLRSCPGGNANWNEYGPPPNRQTETLLHHYEQPFHHCSTIASGASGHYNHLHENYSSGSHHHLAPQSCCVREDPQQFGRRPHHYETMDHSFCKECPKEFGVQLQLNDNGEPRAVHYRHCYDDSQHRTVCFTAPLRRPQDQHTSSYPCYDAKGDPSNTLGGVNHSQRDYFTADANRGMIQKQCAARRPICTLQGGNAVRRCYNTDAAQPSDSPDSDNSFSSRRAQIMMGTSGLQIPGDRSEVAGAKRRQRSSNYPVNKTGRSSDPLSTDQGYDTDSQQQGCRVCGGMHGENDPSCSPRPLSGHVAKPTLVVRSVENTAACDQKLLSPIESLGRTQDDNTPLRQSRIATNLDTDRRKERHDSASDSSDGASENDREVERIIHESTGESVPASLEDSAIHDNEDIVTCSAENQLVEPPTRFGHVRDEDMIDTACGGRVSVAESVTSWCAHPGSNPRDPSYGKNKLRNKKTVDPQVIIANARRQQLQNNIRHNNETDSGSANNGCPRSSSQCNQSKTYMYTLPGTAAAGTKAKIDLKGGGISMITNL